MELFRTTFKAMGCTNEIAVSALDAAEAQRVMERAAREVLRIEAKYSRYRTDSESIVHRINAAAGGAAGVQCDQETLYLLGISDKLYRLSDGLFDITSGILRRVWDFKKPAPPSKEEIAPLLGLIGWDRVERDGNTVRLPQAGMELDFGGFGKEYAVDRAVDVLVQSGIKHAYVSLGGDIRAIGPDPDGKPWIFGVQDPRKKGTVIANIPITDSALATSGDYEKFIKHGGKYFCHILNPRDGISVKCWRSVSVTGVSALSAGAITTIAMLKEADAVAFLKKMNVSYLLVDAGGLVTTNRQSSE